jgi:HTH-type transcriptional regulator/antitoxin HigA
MNAERLAQVLPPGEFLKEELDARGWSQADLADILGRPPRLISEIVTAKRAITPETAQGFGEAFGTGADFWMNLEGQYQLAQTRIDTNAIARRTKIFGQFPVREMQKRGWLTPSRSLSDLESQLTTFFRIRTLEDAVTVPHAAKKTSYDKVSMLQATWLMRAQHLAPKVKVDSYSHECLERLCRELRNCVESVEDSAMVPRLMAAAGIRFLIIEPLPGSKIDAATLWFDEQPLIVLTLRYDRHDIFWHALFHELDHIGHGEGKAEPIVDSNLMAECSHGTQCEKRANKAAATRLIPEDDLEGFVNRFGPVFTPQVLVRFAASQHVHPGVVIGQLQHRELIPWSSFNALKDKIRNVIVPHALTDGFGMVS